ncbi:SDR family NAD(P)-dependent oxidoreductase [Nocardia gamkensis]|uniref:SDR family NAD(P)-dependent oxidoreductase n=1 Tax=Nocardia gamkensis TaxID=352869 RepID=UPI0036E78378
MAELYQFHYSTDFFEYKEQRFMTYWDGKTVVVTGAGRGFGAAFGRVLAAEGAHLALIDVDAAAAAAATDTIRMAGGSAECLEGDVTDEARMNEVMARAAATRGGIDLLINNAGLHSHAYNLPIAKMGLAAVRRLFDVNINGVVTCTLAALPFMKGRAGANIINISSMAAYQGSSAYGTSKLAVAGLTITFGRELGHLGIRVNAVAPGLMLTETIKSELPRRMLDAVKKMQYLDADGAEADVVEAVLFLAGPRAGFITGETLRVTGGAAAGV